MHRHRSHRKLGAMDSARTGTGAESAAATASPREQELREQLKGILQELEDLQKTREGALPPAETAEDGDGEGGAGTDRGGRGTGAMPEYELADTSIVSKRFQKRPEGVSLSVNAFQPRQIHSRRGTMKESMESLPGCGPASGQRAAGFQHHDSRDRASRRRSRFETSRYTKTDSSRPNPTGCRGSIIHDPWFMRSVEVTRGASSSLVRQLCARRNGAVPDQTGQRHQRI